MTAPGAGLFIGVSACFFHADPQRAIFKGKTLEYIEQSMARYVMRSGAFAFLLPSLAPGGAVGLEAVVDRMDGLVLQGGSDCAPQSYGEEPLDPRWSGDRIRDDYERALVEEFMRQGKPVLGICRGVQLLNVAFGGTLYQDIGTQCPGALVHRDWAIYDTNHHDVDVAQGTLLAQIYEPGRHRINSVHHQAIKDLADGFVVEAVSPADGVVEAIRFTATDAWVYAVQWHPEFQTPGDGLLDPDPLMRAFLAAARGDTR